MYISEFGEQWHRARAEPSVVHLDSAAASRSSTAVIDAVTAHLRSESDRGAYVVAEEAAAGLDGTRRDIAAMLGPDMDDPVFIESAQAALAALLSRWGLPSTTTVWVTPNEYGPNLAQFAHLGFTVRAMPTTDGYGRVDTAALDELLRSEKPDLIHICHLGSHGGIVQPAAEIVELAHRTGVPVVIDAAQALGHIDCVTGADVVYGTSRKWIAGPRGVGFVASRTGFTHRVEADSSEAFIAGRVGLGVAVSELHAFGVERVHRELATIGAFTRARLADVPGWTVVEPVEEPSAIVTLAPPPGYGPSDVLTARETLRVNGILTTCADSWRAPMMAERTVLRLSPHLDIRGEHIDRLAGELARMQG